MKYLIQQNVSFCILLGHNNTTKIIIAQRISSIQDADKIVVLDSGKIVGEGSHDELLKNNDIYKEVYYSQIKSSKKGSE